MGRSFWQTTCTSLRRGHEPSWEEVYDYRDPIARHLAIRYGWLSEPEREDLVEDILLALRQEIAARYEPDRGRFRSFLKGVIHNKALARWKKRRRERPLEDLDEPIGPSDLEGEAIDLVALVLGAIRRWHDRYSAGSEDDVRRIYVLVARLVREEAYEVIAEREGVSRDAVKRILQAARQDIVEDVLRHGLSLPAAERDGLDFAALGRAARAALGEPEKQAAHLAPIGQDRVRRALEAWLDGFRDVLRHLGSGETDEGEALRRGLVEVLGVRWLGEATRPAGIEKRPRGGSA